MFYFRHNRGGEVTRRWTDQRTSMSRKADFITYLSAFLERNGGFAVRRLRLGRNVYFEQEKNSITHLIRLDDLSPLPDWPAFSPEGF